MTFSQQHRPDSRGGPPGDHRGPPHEGDGGRRGPAGDEALCPHLGQSDSLAREASKLQRVQEEIFLEDEHNLFDEDGGL